MLGRDISYFVNNHSDSTRKFSETDIITMLKFVIDNIYAMFGGRVFQQTVDISMGTNCAPLLANLFLYSYEADFMQGLLKKNVKRFSRSFNNSRFGDFIDRIYLTELEIMDSTAIGMSVSYLDIHLEIDSELYMYM